MGSGLRLRELSDPYESLSCEERDKLLRILLYAASIGGETVIQRLEEYLPTLPGRKVTREHPEP
jgi:hypothetical protein